jgi:hypothetical protein
MTELLDTDERQDAPDVLRELGWTVGEEAVPAVAERYGRDLSDPFDTTAGAPAAATAGATPPWLSTAFVTAALLPPTAVPPDSPR